MNRIEGNRRARRAQRKGKLEQMKRESSGRSCGTCTACCVLPAIDVLVKPEGKPCQHLRPARGEQSCARYGTRPRVCAEFYCLWRMGEFTEESRPDRSGLVFMAVEEEGIVFLKGIATDEGAIAKNVETFERLWVKTNLPVCLHIPGSQRVAAYGSEEQLARIKAHSSKRRHLPLVGNTSSMKESVDEE
ncbi:MAG TPA: hypothetical protein PK156_33730 [Polyangium sp.]|nr:hypothetical protein [Polyangium sp.]